MQTYENDEFYIEYEYDENGMRYRTTVTNKEDNEVGVFDYVWEEQKLISMVFSEGDTQKLAAKYLYNNSGEVIGFKWVSGSDSQPTYYYLKNLQGDITGIVNSSGKMQISYSYDVFGKRTTQYHANSSTVAGLAEMMDQMFISIVTPFGYRGYCYDEYTDLYYLQSRYYDPNTGRFINADDTNYLNATGTVLGCNLFAYCENDAVNNVDPKGTIAANIVGAVIGAIIGIVGGTFLGNWLADRLALSGNSRTAFVVGVAALVGAAVGTIGYFIGPYVAKIATKLANYAVELIKKGKLAIKRLSGAVRDSLKITQKIVDYLIKNASKLKRTKTVLGHASKRPYINSTYTIQNIMRAGKPVADKTLKYGLKWVVRGSYNGRSGVWELVIDVSTKTIVHFLFKGD